MQICKNCDKELTKSQIKYKNIYCSRSCSATRTNSEIPKRIKKKQYCKECSSEIVLGNAQPRKFCSHACSFLHKKKARFALIEQGKISDRYYLKQYVIYKRGYECEICKISSWQDKKISLQIDHIDGNAGNDFPSNLRLLCPNCHSQTPTFGAKNKGSGRKTRGLKMN